MMPAPGDILQLPLPDGQKRHAVVATFDNEVWRRDGCVLTSSDPEDPVLTLTVTSQVISYRTSCRLAPRYGSRSRNSSHSLLSRAGSEHALSRIPLRPRLT